MVKVAFSVDDVAPVKGFGLLKRDGPLGFLMALNDEFGCKFDLFTIPNMTGKAKITGFPEWCEWVKEQEYFRVQAHGLTHQGIEPEFGAMEFYNLRNHEAENVVREGKKLLVEAGFDPKIFKAPGWFLPKYIRTVFKRYYDILADHIMSTKTYVQSNGIRILPYTLLAHKLHSTHYEDFIVIHAHISPQGGNQNGFTPELYEYVRNYLRELESKQQKVEYVFMEDLLE